MELEEDTRELGRELGREQGEVSPNSWSHCDVFSVNFCSPGGLAENRPDRLALPVPGGAHPRGVPDRLLGGLPQPAPGSLIMFFDFHSKFLSQVMEEWGVEFNQA